jgi:hypothetical protein
MTQINYRLRVLESPEHVREPPAAGMLHAAGISFVIYYGIHFPRPGSSPLNEKAFPGITGEMSYSDRLSPQASVHYSSLEPTCEIPARLVAAAGATEAGAVHRSLVWVDPAFAIMIVPVVFAIPQPYIDWPYIPIRQPLRVDDILGVTDLLTEPSVVNELGRRAAKEFPLADITPIEQSMAIQLWDLGGSRVDGSRLRPDSPYRGLEETQQYCWELSALLSFSTDHVVKDRLWLRRNPSQVFAEVAEAFAFFGDHAVFLNRNCCLEVSHLPIQLRERSRYRMRSYGYDSSSIFIWSLETLRWFALSTLRSQYKQTVLTLQSQKDLSATARTGLLQQRIQHGAVIDQLLVIYQHLKEPRLRAVAAEIDGLWMTDRIAHETQQEIDKSDALAADLAKVREQALETRRNTLLGVVALALALLGIPSLVSQFGSWWDVKDWLGLSISAGLMIVLLIIVALMVRRRE